MGGWISVDVSGSLWLRRRRTTSCTCQETPLGGFEVDFAGRGSKQEVRGDTHAWISVDKFGVRNEGRRCCEEALARRKSASTAVPWRFISEEETLEKGSSTKGLSARGKGEGGLSLTKGSSCLQPRREQACLTMRAEAARMEAGVRS